MDVLSALCLQGPHGLNVGSVPSAVCYSNTAGSIRSSRVCMESEIATRSGDVPTGEWQSGRSGMYFPIINAHLGHQSAMPGGRFAATNISSHIVRRSAWLLAACATCGSLPNRRCGLYGRDVLEFRRSASICYMWAGTYPAPRMTWYARAVNTGRRIERPGRAALVWILTPGNSIALVRFRSG